MSIGNSVCVVVVAYCRPSDTQNVYAAMAAFHQGPVYIFVDRWNEAKPGHQKGNQQVIAWAQAVTQENSQVKLRQPESNMGCQLAIPAAIEWAMLDYEKVIVLEDDCLASPDFFPFAYQMLHRYQDDERIGMISGNNFFPKKATSFFPHADYGFAHYGPTWGWATWRRAWKHYTPTLVGLGNLVKERMSECGFQSKHEFNYWVNLWRKMANSPLHQHGWDARWVFAMRANGLISIIPRVNLIRNIGFSPDTASHVSYTKVARCYVLPRQCLNTDELRHPGQGKVSQLHDKCFYNYVLSKSPFSRLRRFLTMTDADSIRDELNTDVKEFG